MPFTEKQRYYPSESTVYRILKSRDLITAPAFIVIAPPVDRTITAS